MTGMIALAGGDEFRDGCEDMDRAILRAVPDEHPRVLIVPTAAANHSPSMAASNGVSYFSGLDADAAPLMVLDRAGANDEALLSPVDSAHVVYLAGGDPRYLLEVLKDSLLIEKLKGAVDRGAVVAGSSAGGMVLGSWMRYRDWAGALGVVPDVAVLPHHERSQPDEIAGEMATSAPPGALVLGIDAKTCCFGGPDGWTAIGPGAVTAYDQGSWSRYHSGDSVPLTALPAAH